MTSLEHKGSAAVDAIVLAGGKGTRLRSVVSDRPKPMAQVAGRPFVEWLLLALRAQGLRRVVLATGYKGEMIASYFGDGSRLGMELAYAQEEVPLGTGGAMRNALPLTTTARVLTLNGDSFRPFDVGRLAAAHAGSGATATLWLVRMDDCRRYGTVEQAGDGRVLSFREKSPDLGAGLINAGVYLFERAALDAIPASTPVSLEGDVFPALIGRRLYAAAGDGPFLDIGTPESYGSAEAFFTDDAALWDGRRQARSPCPFQHPAPSVSRLFAACNGDMLKAVLRKRAATEGRQDDRQSSAVARRDRRRAAWVDFLADLHATGMAHIVVYDPSLEAREHFSRSIKLA